MSERNKEEQELILQGISTEVKEHFLALQDVAHGWEHVSRVYMLARMIAEQEHADQFIVSAAALMHDLGRTLPQDSERGDTFIHHADASIVIASKILQHYQVPMQTQQAITHAIIAHSFSRGIPPETLEARVVRDADRLDGLGAIGIMRWALVAEQKRQAHTQAYHPEDPLAEHRLPDDRRYMLDHFFAKLLTLSASMTTATGKRIAEQRTAFMRSYIEEFKKELELIH